MSFFRPEILAMSGYTPGEQPRAGKFIKLNTNENPYPASPAVARAIEAALKQGLAKYPDSMATSFRIRAAEVLGVEPDWILCGNGSDDILTIVTRAMVGQGDLIRLPYPSYILYKTLAQLQGAESEETRFERDWSMSDRFVEQNEKLRLAFLPNPNSPSGTMLSKERVRQIAERLACPLLVDEAYVDFADENCIDLVRENERVLVSRTLSKSYALAGLRFGFVVAQPHVIEQLAKVKDSYNCDALSIAAATAAIDDQNWLAENKRKIVANRAKLTAAMRELGFSGPESHANFVWNEHSEQPARPLYERLKAERILVRYMEYPGWGEGLRVSVGNDDQIDALLSVLKSAL
jgi:histidinol-phosphate aminotransferase